MARPKFDATLIGELRNRVIAHNASRAGRPVKLGELKKAYYDGFGGARPGERAMSKVDDLLKAATFDGAEHPRDGDGKFADKGSAKAAPRSASQESNPALPRALPKTPEAHQREQADNAGYRALTTEALPTQQHELLGAGLRHLGSGLAGAAILASLLRGKPNGVLVRGVRAATGSVGRFAAAIPAAMITRGAETGAHAIAQAARRATGRPLAGAASHAVSGKMTSAAAKFGEKVGRKIGEKSARGVSTGARAFMHAVGEAGKPSPGMKTVRRVAAFTALAGVPAGLIDSEIKDTPYDPQLIGRGIDAYSYRTVQKLADSADLEAARLEYRQIIADGGGVDALRKLNVRAIPGLVTNVGRALGIGGAAVGGAALGAGAGALAHHLATGQKRGNPYHDASGKFTSRENAKSGTALSTIGGAALGAAAAGAGVYAALRSHNTRALGGAIEHLTGGLSRRLRAINSERGVGRVAEMIRDRQADIDEAVRSDKGLTDRLAVMDRYGPSDADHYKTAMRHEINLKLASFLSHRDDVKIPVNGDAPIDMRTIRAQSRQPAEAMVHAGRFVEGASPKAFEAAIADLSPGEKETARHWFDNRQKWVNEVDDQIAAHHAKIDEAHKKVEELAERARNEAGSAKDARALVEREPEGESKVSAQAAADAADKEAARHAAAHQKAVAALDKLRRGPGGVISPVTNKPLAVPSQDVVNFTKRKLRVAAEDKHAKRIDKKIADARQAQAARVENQHRQLMAAKIKLGLEHGATVPAHALPHAARVVETQDALHAAKGRLELAAREHEAAQAMLKETRRLAGTKVRLPKDQYDTEADDAFDSQSRAAGDLADATARARDKQGAKVEAEIAHQKAHADAGHAVHEFERQLKASPDAARGTILPPKLADQLRYEWDRATRAGGRMKDFAAGITPRAVKNFAGNAGTHAKSVGNAALAGIQDTYHRAFFHTGSNGTRVLSPRKVLASSVIGLSAAGGLAEHFTNARDWVLGTPEERAKAKPITPPRGFKFEHHEDPVTGEGFSAIHGPHPTEKGERVLLWGQRYRAGSTHGEALFPGAKLSEVKRRVTEAQQQQKQAQQSSGGGGGGAWSLQDAPNFGGPDRGKVDAAVATLKGQNKLDETRAEGAAMSFRQKADNDQNGAAGAFMGHVRQKFLNNPGGAPGGLVHGALSTLFSNQGRVLKRGQAFSLLTGFTPGGEQKGNSILKPDTGFKSHDKDEVAEALHTEVDRIMAASPPNHDRARGALHLAVETIGQEKGLSREAIDAVHAKIRSAGAAGSTKQVDTAQTEAASQPQARWKGIDPELGRTMPEGWSALGLRNAAERHAEEMPLAIDNAELTPVIEHLARAVGHSHGLNEGDAAHAAAEAIKHVARGGGANRAMTLDAIKGADVAAFMGALQQQADHVKQHGRKPLQKTLLIDDLDALMKAALDVGDAAGASGAVAHRAREAVGDLAEAGVKGIVQRREASGQSWYNPIRAGVETAGLFGGEIAGKLAAKFIPGASAAATTLEAGANGELGSGVQRAIKAVVGLGTKQGIKTAARTAVRQGGALVAGSLGYAGAGAAAEAVSPVAYKPPAYRSTGEALSEIGGQLLGGLAGGISGIPGGLVGSAAVGAAGAYAGGVAARGTYDRISSWFGGYDEGNKQKALARIPGATPAPSSGGGTLSQAQIQERRNAAKARWAEAGRAPA